MKWRTALHANGPFAYICIIPGKFSENHLHAWFSPCGQVIKSIKSRGQICPILLRRKRAFPDGLENNHACKCSLDNFPGIICISTVLENCQKSICIHGCSLIHVENIFVCLSTAKDFTAFASASHQAL